MISSWTAIANTSWAEIPTATPAWEWLAAALRSSRP